MARIALIRTNAAACVGAALLELAALIGFVTIVGSDKIGDAARDWTFYIPATFALGSAVLLAIGLVGLYLHQETPLGAFEPQLSCSRWPEPVVAAGGQWTYVFVVTHFAGSTPSTRGSA